MEGLTSTRRGYFLATFGYREWRAFQFIPQQGENAERACSENSEQARLFFLEFNARSARTELGICFSVAMNRHIELNEDIESILLTLTTRQF
jgi:hypothetical protein